MRDTRPGQKGQQGAETSRWRDSQTCLKARGREAQGAKFEHPGGKQERPQDKGVCGARGCRRASCPRGAAPRPPSVSQGQGPGGPGGEGPPRARQGPGCWRGGRRGGPPWARGRAQGARVRRTTAGWAGAQGARGQGRRAASGRGQGPGCPGERRGGTWKTVSENCQHDIIASSNNHPTLVGFSEKRRVRRHSWGKDQL